MESISRFWCCQSTMFFKVQFGLHWNFTYNKLKDQKALTLASLEYICSHTKNIDKDLIGPAVFIFRSVVSGCGCISHNQMLSLQLLSFHYKPNTLISHLLVHSDAAFKKRRSHPSSFPSCIVHAVEKDSQHFEVDTDKAREALQELDQQLQSLSQKQVKSPKMRGTHTLFLGLMQMMWLWWCMCVEMHSIFLFFGLWYLSNFCVCWGICGLSW